MRFQLIILVAIGLFLGTLSPAAIAAPTERPPNIIYILADDLGYGDLSCYGQQKFATPHIDRLATDGMRFTQHYSGSTVCAPSRSTIMTGLHTGHTPIRGNAEVQPEGQEPLPQGIPSLPKHLQMHGYVTGGFGKWGLGAPNSHGAPPVQGFNHFYGYNCQRQAHHYYPYFLWNDGRREILWNNFGRQRGDYAPTLIQQQVLEFVATHRDQPFFLYYAHVIPHAEMFAEEDKIANFRGKFGEEKPYHGVDDGPGFRKSAYGSQSDPKAAFAAMVTTLDDHVGQLIAKLEELGLSDDTLIVFSSDNGPHLEGGHQPNYFNSNGGLRGHKRDLYEGGIRVPFIAKWPGKIASGSTSDHVCAQWDLFPTFAEVAGSTVDQPIDGISFVPTLRGQEEQPSHDYLYWEFHGAKGRQAVRRGDWKAVRYNVIDDPNSTPELYNLALDPAESSNVATDHPAVVEELAHLMKTARTPSENPRFNFPRRRRK